MPENTDHPTQKPEKLIAKLILASTNPGDIVFDPFLGSGTTAVVCRKLNRHFFAIEQNTEYCCWALKRLDMAKSDTSIQGYFDGVFWERNSLANQKVSSGPDCNTSTSLIEPKTDEITDIPNESITRRPRGRPKRNLITSAPNLNLFTDEQTA